MGAEDCEEMKLPKKMICVIKFERDEMDDAVGVGKGRGWKGRRRRRRGSMPCKKMMKAISFLIAHRLL